MTDVFWNCYGHLKFLTETLHSCNFPPLVVYSFHSCFINTAAKEKYDLCVILVPISIADSTL